MFRKISFGGSYSSKFIVNIPDLTKREFIVLLTLAVPTVMLGIYPGIILYAIHYSVSTLIYSFDFNYIINCDAPEALGGTNNNVDYAPLTFFVVLALLGLSGLVLIIIILLSSLPAGAP